ncbi:AMP-binding protein [Rhodobacter calidifons]|uniref:4-coumarate--CoA ligase family protein n=1 Tax=Rhodobacter calidifons TaxID=2715277 RepID=A0ABX0G5T3_9RHOB|nr:AMP-binding protein [Rhodobacter calidifons]NHB76141.1 4-coumarate--CoA ligase family protein [Rhodobacter calidifons]
MIHASPFPPIALTGESITERIFRGLVGDPDRVVLIDGPSGREMTAGALEAGIRRLAGGLKARGIGKGDVVAILAPNCPEYAVVFHGVAFAGATVTTINPTYTAPEVSHQLTDSGARLLVTVPAFLETARAAFAGEIVVIGEAEGATPLTALMGEPLAEQVPIDAATDVVVLPYSSGTTGLPKGVRLSHRNLVANVDQCLAVIGCNPGEWSVGFLPFFHIYGQTVLMNLHLAAGAGVVTMPRFDLEQFLTLAAKYRTPTLYSAPPVAVALAKHPMVDQFDLSCVERFFSGAAPLGGDVGDAVAGRIGCLSVQGYGMTEMSPVSHATPRGQARKGSVGVTLPSTECRIVVDGRDAGPGEAGELWVRGPQVMLGYHNRPEATAETLVDGWLRTGDLAEVDAEGWVYIRDRLKELIKVKGFQVAPAEVEAVLLTCPMVRDAAVRGVPDDEAGEVPVAFVVPTEGAEEAAIRAHLAGQLAHYKLPKRITFIEAIPKSASGKILRRMLPV